MVTETGETQVNGGRFPLGLAAIIGIALSAMGNTSGAVAALVAWFVLRQLRPEASGAVLLVAAVGLVLVVQDHWRSLPVAPGFWQDLSVTEMLSAQLLPLHDRHAVTLVVLLGLALGQSAAFLKIALCVLASDTIGNGLLAVKQLGQPESLLGVLFTESASRMAIGAACVAVLARDVYREELRQIQTGQIRRAIFSLPVGAGAIGLVLAATQSWFWWAYYGISWWGLRLCKPSAAVRDVFAATLVAGLTLSIIDPARYGVPSILYPAKYLVIQVHYLVMQVHADYKTLLLGLAIPLGLAAMVVISKERCWPPLLLSYGLLAAGQYLREKFVRQGATLGLSDWGLAILVAVTACEVIRLFVRRERESRSPESAPAVAGQR